MNIKDVEKVITLMKQHGLSEVEIEDSKGKIRLKKEREGEIAKEIIHIPDISTAEKSAAPENSAQKPGSTQEEPARPGIENIVSPLVGTFYRKPDPDSDPFVEVGEHVDEDTVICVVEAMKVMNEIKAEKSGTITKALIDDAHPVEYLQPMFEIKTDEQ